LPCCGHRINFDRNFRPRLVREFYPYTDKMKSVYGVFECIVATGIAQNPYVSVRKKA
jgi:hypothetical protein